VHLVGFTIEKIKVVISVIWLGCKAVMVVTIFTKALEEISSTLKMNTDGSWLH